MSDKIVWILGAGFSKALGAPLLSELFSTAQLDRVLLCYKEAFTDDERQLLQDITRFYQAGSYRIYSSKALQNQWQHTEEFLERLDLAATSASERERLDRFRQRFCEYCLEQKPSIPGIFNDAIAGLIDIDFFAKIHLLALKLLAAECCAFLEGATSDYEIWQPYMRWAKLLTENDTVLTFNYDRVPDILTGVVKDALRIPSPLALKQGKKLLGKALTLKLHGCVTWVDEGFARGYSRIARACETHDLRGASESIVAPLHCAQRQRIAIATPGPTKRQRVQRPVSAPPPCEEEAGLDLLWRSAQAQLENADAIVVIGYSLPPTDAYTREWLLAHIATAAGKRLKDKRDWLRVHVVLGPVVSDPSVVRLAALLRDIRGAYVYVRPLWAEDFLASFDRVNILERAASTPAT